MSITIDEPIYEEYLGALIDGDRHHCSTIISQLQQAGLSFVIIYQQLMRRALYRIGELWEQNQISVATEHLATAPTEGLLNQLYPTIDRQKTVGKRILIASVERELHQIGARMVCDVFESRGWDAFYLGANTPVTELLDFIDNQHPHAIGLSMSIYFNLDTLLRMIVAIRQEHPMLPILIGGQGLRTIGEKTAARFDNCYFATDLEQIIELIPSLLLSHQQ